MMVSRKIHNKALAGMISARALFRSKWGQFLLVGVKCGVKPALEGMKKPAIPWEQRVFHCERRAIRYETIGRKAKRHATLLINYHA